MSRFAKIQAGFAIASLLLLAVAQAQVSQDWMRQYDGSHHSNDYSGPMAVDRAGNVIVAGQSQGGFLTIKYSAAGDTVWMLADAAGPSGSIYDLTVDAEDNVYVTGYTYTGSAYSGDQWVTSKYSPDGSRGWSRAFDGQGGPAGDCGYGVAVDDSGYVYVTGISTMDNRSRITTLKYDSEGMPSPTWPNIGSGTGVRRYENVTEPSAEYGYRVAVDEESNVYVIGVSAHPVGGPYDFLTLKYSATGQEIWCQRYDGPAGQGDAPVGIALDDSANVFVAGTALVPNQSGATRPDYATIKYDTNGNPKWVALYNGPADYEDRCAALAVDGDGHAYVTGYSCRASTDYATIKYEPDGEQAWVAFHDGEHHANDEAADLVVDASGYVYVTGKVVMNTGYYDFGTVKYDASGQECWAIASGSPEQLGDAPTAIALGPSGAVYVHGTCSTSSCWSDWLTIKYVQGSGAVGDDAPVAITLCESRPNPFHAATTIAFELARQQRVTLKLYDLNGREIATLLDGDLDAGSHRHTFRAGGLACGAYLCRLQAGDASTTRKLVLVR